MKSTTRILWWSLHGMLVALLVGTLIWLTKAPDPGRQTATVPTTAGGAPVRIGLIPERDIFKQRKRYQTLARYLSARLDRPVRLVTLNSYEAVLTEFAEKRIEGAFLGSLVSTLAIDRLGAQVVARPELADGSSTYHGVIFVRADSPIKTLEAIGGHSIAMVRMTTAGHLFPGCVLMRLGLLSKPDGVHKVWVGTHDDVVSEVVAGRIEVGAAKNLRLEAVLRAHPEWKIRILARGRSVPSNALLLRKDVPAELASKITSVLLGMAADSEGHAMLEAVGTRRFIPCDAEDYMPIYNMIDCIHPDWEQIDISGPMPRRPTDWPKPDPQKVRPCYVVSY